MRKDFGDIPLSGAVKCKICGKNDFTMIGEVQEHMMTHKEYRDGLDKVMPGFSKVTGYNYR